MEKFIYKNAKGQAITIQYGGSYILESYDGLAAAEVIPITSKGYRQHGNKLNYVNLGTRLINIYFYIHAEDMADFYAKRRNLSVIFNPLLGEGELTYVNDYMVKTIRVLPTVLPTTVEKFGTLQLLNIELTANDPFWYDAEENCLLMGSYANGLTFPLEQAEYKFADLDTFSEVIIDGDIETPLTIEFSGEAQNPKITNETTGEFIQVSKVMTAADKLTITTHYGNKTVIFTDANGESSSAYHLITNDSSFFQLQTGKNILRFSSELGQPEVSLTWRNRYVGV